MYTLSMRYLTIIGTLLLMGCTVHAPGPQTPPLPHADLIHVTSPLPGQTVGTTFDVTGEARGMWYFEASFPVSVEDTSGRVILQTHAQALGEWMTEAFVPFKATIELPQATEIDGVLVIKNDNPSGLPENEKEVRIPIHIRN